MYMYLCICIFVVFFQVSYVTASYSLCGNWESFRDEKCFKILDVEKLVTFDEAIKSCPEMDNMSELLTIHSKEEQDFISTYLFKTNKLVENVWIGMRNKSGHFEWTDNSNKQYTNWKAGNPMNKADFNCVQLESDTFMWSNEPCNKKSLVVCQKMPETILSDLMKQVNELRENFKKSEQTKNEIFNVVFNKDISHYQLFTDTNGMKKAFLIPSSTMRNQYTFDDSVKLCKNFNSTLIEVDSLAKQIMLESFLGRLGFESNQVHYFWINAERNPSGKWKWLNSDKEPTFTNWYTNYPMSNSDYNYIAVGTYSADTFGKWGNNPKTFAFHVMCEHTFEF